MEIIFCWLITGIICGMIGERLCKEKGNGGVGGLLGFLFGPLGILIAVLLTEKRSGCERRIVKKLYVPAKADPMLEWESKEKAKSVLPVPTHLRGRKVDEE